MTPKAAIAAFLDAAGTRHGLSERTVEAYRRDLERFRAWCEQSRGIETVADLVPAHIQAFAAGEHRRGLDPRTVQRRLAALRRFFDDALARGIVKANPAAGIKAPRTGRKLPRVPDVDQVMRLLELPGNGPLIDRDRAMLELFYSSGLRLSELAALNWSHLDLNDGMVRVTGKGDKTRVIPVGRPARTALSRLAAAHPSAPDDPVFLSRRGGRLSRRAIQQRLTHWSQRQGLDQRLHPHLLRHAFASHILESSGDLRAVQELLGHSNLSTTQIYTHLDFQHLAEVYDRTHPRARRRR